MHIASFTHIARFHNKCTPHRMHMNIACIHITCTCALTCRCATTQHASIIDSLFAALLQLASHMALGEGHHCACQLPHLACELAFLSPVSMYVCMYSTCLSVASLPVCMHACMYVFYLRSPGDHMCELALRLAARRCRAILNCIWRNRDLFLALRPKKTVLSAVQFSRSKSFSSEMHFISQAEFRY